MAEPALSILRDVLQGAYTLRRRGAVYRDIKLQNMLLAENGRTVFCYHGQAITMPNPESNRIRNPGIFLYLAPGLRSGTSMARRMFTLLLWSLILYLWGIWLATVLRCGIER